MNIINVSFSSLFPVRLACGMYVCAVCRSIERRLCTDLIGQEWTNQIH